MVMGSSKLVKPYLVKTNVFLEKGGSVNVSCAKF